MSWAAFFSAIQLYLNEPKVRPADSQPAWLTIITSVVGLLTCYSDFVLPRNTPKFTPKVPLPSTDVVEEAAATSS